MREILFRGKRKDNGQWVEGHLIDCQYVIDEQQITAIVTRDTQIFPHCEVAYEEVIPDTVGQFTGLTDKNGRKMFEGDIVTIASTCADMTGVVEFHDCGFEVREGDTYECLWYEPDEVEVIGNIHDNPELLNQ